MWKDFIEGIAQLRLDQIVVLGDVVVVSVILAMTDKLFSDLDNTRILLGDVSGSTHELIIINVLPVKFDDLLESSLGTNDVDSFTQVHQVW